MSNPYQPPAIGGVAAQPPNMRGKIGQIRIVAILMMVQGALELMVGLIMLTLAVILPLTTTASAPEAEQIVLAVVGVYGGMGLGTCIAAILHIV